MKVKTIMDIYPHGTNRLRIKKGSLLEVDQMNSPLGTAYRIKSGPFTGTLLASVCCTSVEEKTYTEKEWNDLEKYYLGIRDLLKSQKRVLEIELNSARKEISRLQGIIDGAYQQARNNVHKSG